MNTTSRRALLIAAAVGAALLRGGEAMAAVATGAQAPAFSAPDADGRARALEEFRGRLVVLEWTNHECPFVKKHYGAKNMQGQQKDATGKDVIWLTINSSAPGLQGHVDGLAANNIRHEAGAAQTAYLHDPDGSVGRLYGAKTTPHMFVIDAAGRVAYQGALDDRPATSGDPSTAKNYVRAAVEELLEGKAVALPQTKAYGCSVKYAK